MHQNSAKPSENLGVYYKAIHALSNYALGLTSGGSPQRRREATEQYKGGRCCEARASGQSQQRVAVHVAIGAGGSTLEGLEERVHMTSERTTVNFHLLLLLMSLLAT